MRYTPEGVIVRKRITFTLSSSVAGTFATPQLLETCGVRGQVLGWILREPVGGVVTECTPFIFDAHTATGLSQPPAEDGFYFHTFTAITPSAVNGYEDWLAQTDGGYYFVTEPSDLKIGLAINTVSAATASTIVLEVYVAVQTFNSSSR
jgi:hypothetical protein